MMDRPKMCTPLARGRSSPVIRAHAPATTMPARIHEAGMLNKVNSHPTATDRGATIIHRTAITRRAGWDVSSGSGSLTLGRSPYGGCVFLGGLHCSSVVSASGVGPRREAGVAQPAPVGTSAVKPAPVG